MMPQERLSEILEKRYRGFTGYCGIFFDEVLDEGCKVSCALRPELLNPDGIAHGGLIATLTDVAAGLMALQADGWAHSIVTQNCNIHYLRPGSGDRLWAESHVIRKGHKEFHPDVDRPFRDFFIVIHIVILHGDYMVVVLQSFHGTDLG